jgi:hypothetical protein
VPRSATRGTSAISAFRVVDLFVDGVREPLARHLRAHLAIAASHSARVGGLFDEGRVGDGDALFQKSSKTSEASRTTGPTATVSRSR